jgi:hypothetical protein
MNCIAGQAPGRPKRARVPWATKGPMSDPGDRPTYSLDEGLS